jgi:hypothetical protein
MHRITGLITLVLTLCVTGAAQAQADTRPRAELGFRSGLTLYHESGQTLSVLSFPGANLFSMSTVHLMLFATPSLALEPQVGIVRLGTESSSSGLFTGAFQVNQFLRDPEAGSVFALLNGGFTTGFGSGGSDTYFALGGGAGYRMIVRETLGVRLEGRYRRLFDDAAIGTNEFSILVGLGAVLGR